MEASGILKERKRLQETKPGFRINSAIKDTLFIFLGIFSAAFGLESFFASQPIY